MPIEQREVEEQERFVNEVLLEGIIELIYHDQFTEVHKGEVLRMHQEVLNFINVLACSNKQNEAIARRTPELLRRLEQLKRIYGSP